MAGVVDVAFDEPGGAVGDAVDVVLEDDFVGVVDAQGWTGAGVVADLEGAHGTFPPED